MTMLIIVFIIWSSKLTDLDRTGAQSKCMLVINKVYQNNEYQANFCLQGPG